MTVRPRTRRARRAQHPEPGRRQLLAEIGRDRVTQVLCVLLLFCLTVGGGGSPAEVAETLVLLFSLAALFLLMVLQPGKTLRAGAVWRADWRISACVTALLVLYAVQLVPLPLAIWAMLPGRGVGLLNLQTYEALPWLPGSIDPGATLAAILSFLPPLIAYALATHSGRSGWRAFGVVMAGFAVLTIGLQLLQTTGGFFPYEQTKIDFTSGFQANRNAQGDVLMILMTLLAIRERGHESAARFAFSQLGAGLVIMMAVVFTGSRAGMVITVIPFLWLCWNALRALSFSRAKAGGVMAGAAVAMAGGAAALIAANRNFSAAMERFVAGMDGRTTRIWPDAIYAAEQLSPLGAGAGTFMRAFELFESQETIVHAAANRAHNEALEIAIESGFPGLIIVALLILAIFWRVSREAVMGADRTARNRAAAVLVITSLLLLHSAVDYPLRSISIAVLYATLLGFVVGGAAPEAVRQGERSR